MAEAIEPTLAKLMGDMPRVALSSMTDINTALIPVPKLEMDSYDRYARHHAELELQESGAASRADRRFDHAFLSGSPIELHVNGRVRRQST
jgi:hypothetical protein